MTQPLNRTSALATTQNQLPLKTLPNKETKQEEYDITDHLNIVVSTFMNSTGKGNDRVILRRR